MKKALIVLLLLAVAAGIALVGYAYLNQDTRREEIPFADCEREAVGTWSAADGDSLPLQIRADHTATVMGENVTWEVTYSYKGSGGTSQDFFTLTFTDADGQVKYRVSFDYNSDRDIWVCRNVSEIDRDGKYHAENNGVSFSRFKEGTVDTIPLSAENWHEYFEIRHFLNVTESIDDKDWLYYAYVCLKPEYVSRVLPTGFKLGLYYDINAHAYFCTVDVDAQTIAIGDPCPDVPAKNLCEPVYYHINPADHKLRDGYLTLATIATSRDFLNDAYTFIADDIFIGNANGTLVLVK